MPNKTKPEDVPVDDFLAGLDDPVKLADSHRLIHLMRAATGEEPTMWGPSIIGFGGYHYRYPSGREGDAPLVGFSPRRAAISLYTATDEETRTSLLSRLGRHTSGKGCVYVKRLTDIDEAVLVELIEAAVAFSSAQDVH